MEKESKGPPRQRSPASARPRPVTASYLRNAAMHYLSGRAASAAMVRATLVRRSVRRLGVRSLEPATLSLIDAAIAELSTLGLIDDGRFAQTRAASLRDRGLSKRRIGLGLKLKGIDADLATAAQAGIDDLTQARRFAERKRLGRWRHGGADPASRDKDLRALARAGFSYPIAARALAADDDGT